MTHESYKAWLDEMPIDDVRKRIERLEKKLWDLHVLERLYDERHGSGEEPTADEGDLGEAAPVEGEPASEGHEHGEHSEGEPSFEQGEEHAGG
jgi:hypothetical protein